MRKSASSILLPMYVSPTLPASDVLLMKGQIPLPAPSAIPSCAHTVTHSWRGGETAIGGIHPDASLSVQSYNEWEDTAPHLYSCFVGRKQELRPSPST